MGGGGRSRVGCMGRLIVETVEETDAGQQPINGVRLTARGPSGSRTRTSSRRGDGSTKANFGNLHEGAYTLHVGDTQVGTEQVMAQATTEATVVIQRVMPIVEIADPKILLVKKSFHENPHRIAVDVSTSEAFDGWGLLRCNRPRQIHLYETQEGGTGRRAPIRISGEDLSGGVTFYIEADEPSNDVDGTTLTLELHAGSYPVGDPASDNLTCVEVQLDICRPRSSDDEDPTPLPQNRKNDPGRVIQLQDADDTKPRAMLIVRKAVPHTFTGNLILDRNNESVALFGEDEEEPNYTQTAQEPPLTISNGDIPDDPGRRYWVEGTALSEEARDTRLELSLEDVPDIVGDRVAITVVKLPLVRIESLDKWFIPGPDGSGETCDITYALEGMSEEWPSIPFADKVVFDVYASNYCSATVRTDNTIRFRTLRNPVPVYRRENAPAEVENSHNINDWRGETSVTSGVLQVREGQQRYINVAFSPYTAHFRFYKNDADRDARLHLHDFWPRWDDAGGVVNDSLMVRWEIQRCSKLRIGKLIIVDKDNNEVHTHDLGSNDLSRSDRGAHEYQWDGAGINQNLMPYRVQIYAYTNEEESDGVALAAMHTEVRLYAHSDTGTHPADPVQDTNSLQFALAPFTPNVPERSSVRPWYQYQLAEGGFHPGPITGVHGPDTQRAIREFQRSFPSNTAAPFRRLLPNGSVNADTTTALGRLAADERPMFGNPTDRSNFTRAQAQTRLNEKNESIIFWIDDRHYYTQAGAHRMFMQNYHGGFDIGDARVGRDESAIVRPWIPLEASLALRPKGTELNSDSNTRNDTTRRAIGPVRVDWTFGEIGEDLTLVDTSHANYNNTRVRSNRWVQEVTTDVGDTQDGRVYTNCPELNWYTQGGVRRRRTVGGIRPVRRADNTTDIDTYYRAPFGRDAQSLTPWRAMADDNTKSICTLVHDDLAQNESNLHNDHVGKAGLYLHPSRIAGDGYQFRAQVCFDQLPGGAANRFPNQDVLKRRYSRLPQAHTSKVRMWRKTSYRGYVVWAPAAEKNWPAHAAPCAEFYRAAHIHFIHEGGAATEYPLTGADPLVTPDEYRDVINENVTHADYTGLTITFNADRVWPYCNEPHLGVPQGGPGTTINNFYDRVLDPRNSAGVFDRTWRSYREDLLHLLIRKIEESRGRLRGHFLVEFRSSQAYQLCEYHCNHPGCGTTRTEVITNCAPGDLLQGTPCPTAGCPGTMQAVVPPAPPDPDGLPLPAVGVSMGGTWLFTTGAPDVWAHEIGHHRHLEHAQAWPGNANPAPFRRSGTNPADLVIQRNQHDSEQNPDPGLAGEPNKDRGWDRCCIMSYSHGPVYFCGKCIMKNRGWAIEHLDNPAGNLHN